MTVSDVLDQLAVWAEDEGRFWQSGYYDPVDPQRRCVLGELGSITQAELTAKRLNDQTVARLKRAAKDLDYRDLVDANDRGGLPAVRQMIAMAREEAGR